MKLRRSKVFEAAGRNIVQSSPPRVTFVVPCFNETPEILAESLGSVAAQDCSDFECFVIDDSTNPLSSATCAEFCAADLRFTHIVPPERLGLAASLNLGIAQARGEFIARFDSDDICLPHRLSLQLSAMDHDPNIDVLGGGLEIMDKNGGTIAFRDYPADHSAIAQQFHGTTPIAHPTVLMRRTSVQAAGGYDPEFRFAEDLDLWLRLLNHGARFANVQQTLVRYRQQNTNRNPDHWRYNLRARRKNLARPYLLRRLIGIGVIGVWTHTPVILQKAVFRMLLLRKPKGLTVARV
jgi:glycosyltransferase involved in cell wall biosynthesis